MHTRHTHHHPKRRCNQYDSYCKSVCSQSGCPSTGGGGRGPRVNIETCRTLGRNRGGEVGREACRFARDFCSGGRAQPLAAQALGGGSLDECSTAARDACKEVRR